MSASNDVRKQNLGYLLIKTPAQLPNNEATDVAVAALKAVVDERSDVTAETLKLADYCTAIHIGINRDRELLVYVPFLSSAPFPGQPGRSQLPGNDVRRELVTRFTRILPGCLFLDIRKLNDGEDEDLPTILHYRGRSLVAKFAGSNGRFVEYGLHPKYRSFPDELDPAPASLPVVRISTTQDMFNNYSEVVGGWESSYDMFRFLDSADWREAKATILSTAEHYRQRNTDSMAALVCIEDAVSVALRLLADVKNGANPAHAIVFFTIRHIEESSLAKWNKHKTSWFPLDGAAIDMTDPRTVVTYATRGIMNSVLELCPPGMHHLVLKWELPPKYYDDEDINLDKLHSHGIQIVELKKVSDGQGGLRLENEVEFLHRFGQVYAENGLFSSVGKTDYGLDDESLKELFGSSSSDTWCQLFSNKSMWKIIYVIFYLTKKILGNEKQADKQYRKFCRKLGMSVGFNWLSVRHFPGPNGGDVLPTYQLSDQIIHGNNNLKIGVNPGFLPLPSYFSKLAVPTLRQYIDLFDLESVHNAFLLAAAETEEGISNADGRPSSSGRTAYM